MTTLALKQYCSLELKLKQLRLGNIIVNARNELTIHGNLYSTVYTLLIHFQKVDAKKILLFLLM